MILLAEGPVKVLPLVDRHVLTGRSLCEGVSRSAVEASCACEDAPDGRNNSKIAVGMGLLTTLSPEKSNPCSTYCTVHPTGYAADSVYEDEQQYGSAIDVVEAWTTMCKGARDDTVLEHVVRGTACGVSTGQAGSSIDYPHA